MSTLSSILNTGRSALQVQELAMQVLGHNLANVGTDGYSRRRVDTGTSAPGGIGQYNVGSGVDVQWIGRIRDSLLDSHIRESESQISYWSQRNASLENVETILNGLGDVNIDTRLQSFWGAWQDLANDPENESARMALLQKTESLTSSVRRTYEDLQGQLANANHQIRAEVDTINQLTAQIAGLNVEISQAELNGVEAPDLRDSRDAIVEQLAGIINISVEEASNGTINVYSSGQMLVQVDRNVDLYVTSIAANSSELPQIKHGVSGREMAVENGRLKALLDLRDADIVPAIEDLNEMATTLADRVNAIHRTGFGLDNTSGIDFFASDITGAADFQVSELIRDDSTRIAASAAPDAFGDNSIALEIAAVQNEKLMNGGRNTIDEFNRNISLRTGTSLAYAASQLDIEQAANENLVSRRASISGVSIDEEMTNMIQVQKAYEAAAEVVKTVDEMISTLLAMRS